MDRWVDVLIKFLSVFVIEGIGELVMGYFFIIVGLSSSWIIRIHFTDLNILAVSLSSSINC